MGRFGGKFFVWTFALGLALGLFGLLVATSESIRRAEVTSPFMERVEPELPLQHAPVGERHHPPGVAAWMTP